MVASPSFGPRRGREREREREREEERGRERERECVYMYTMYVCVQCFEYGVN